MSDLRSQLRDFFTFHYSDSPTGYINIWVDGPSYYASVSDIDKAIDLVLSRRESANIYYGVALRKEELPPNRRGAKLDCLSVSSLWLDIDVGTFGHKAKNLPPDVASVMPLLTELRMNPSAIVNSAGGLHVYYRLDAPFQLTTRDDILRFERLNRALNKAFGALCAARGWEADIQTCNVDRILRVPFTFNMKEGGQRPVELVGIDTPRYSFTELEARFCGTKSTAAVVPAAAASLDDTESVPADKAIAHVIKKLKNIRRKGLAEIAQAVIKGESLASGGERDATLHKICAAIATIDPDSDPETLAEVLRPSLEQWADEPGAGLTVDEELAKAVDKIARSQSYGKEKRSQTETENSKMRQLSIVLARRLQGEKGDYTDDEIRQFANDQNCTVDEFQKRWLIQKGKSFYVYVDGKYKGPRHKDELECALPVDLAPASVQWSYTTSDGKDKRRTAKEMAAFYGSVASRIVADLRIDKSYYDPDTETFYEAVCPRRNIEPVFHTQVDRWLRLLGGANADKLLDWLATATDLTRQTCALYFSGTSGAGKGMFAKGIARLWNDGAPTSLANILNGFNHDLTRCPLIFADEKLPDIKGISTKLREIIGTETMTLARKYMDNAELKGAVRIVIAGNNQHLLAVDKDEELGPDDLEAVAGRFLHITVEPAARAYLESLGGAEGTKGWVDKDIIAAHVLWLAANREVVPGKRFLVEGHMTQMHEMLATAGKWTALTCEWIVRHLVDASPAVNSKSGVIVGGGELLVNSHVIVDCWDSYIRSAGRPSVQLIGRSLTNISSGDKRLNSIRYKKIKVEALMRWADTNQIGDVDVMKAAIAGPVTEPRIVGKMEVRN
jgi:hypothetical protein